MKIYYSIIFAFLITIGLSVGAQSISEGPALFKIFAADEAGNFDKETPITWYIEDGGISNAAGIGVAALSGNTQDAFKDFLKSLSTDPLVQNFKIDEQSMSLVISLKGVSPSEMEAALSEKLLSFSKIQGR